MTLIPSGPAPRGPRNPFDNAVVPGRSLAERITVPKRDRSSSPGRNYDDGGSRRRDDRDVDSYRPSGSRDPMPRGRRDGGRRAGGRGEGRGRGGRGGERGERGGERAEKGRDGRPRKTQEELDAEMDNYFGGGGEQNGGEEQHNGAAAPKEEDIDMIE